MGSLVSMRVGETCGQIASTLKALAASCAATDHGAQPGRSTRYGASHSIAEIINQLPTIRGHSEAKGGTAEREAVGQVTVCGQARQLLTRVSRRHAFRPTDLDGIKQFSSAHNSHWHWYLATGVQHSRPCSL